ncbi:amine oxidase [Neolentinus lepideus HHB14362 ss-1]|uniref:Amine oxidase n=1 Tax=Neolentinus lepideus HHB14362 ss-1 TaxID=1314782 RepID=A0A165N458_9AGAM|nr:amine oxidase [Neolentinus lepideus HHB14362 ss-1]
MHLPLLPLLLAPALALPTPPSPPYNATVLILGGGVAGVIAARTLARLAPSTSFLLLEARTELGGRLQSHRFPGYTLELGANWVHGTHTLGFDAVNPVWEMVERWGVQTVVSDYYGSITTYDHTGPVPYLSLLNDSLAAYATLVAHSPALAASSNLSSSARDGYSSLGYSPHTPHEHAAEYYTFDWEYADAPERTSWWASGSSTNNTYDPTTGGFSRTNHFSTDPRGFSHFLTQEAHEFLKPGQVVFNATVRSVRPFYPTASIEIELTTGTVLRAEYALCTFSLGVLQGGIRWSEEVMPPAKREAVRGMSMGVFTKIFLQFEEKFWFDTEFALYADPHTHGRYPVWQSLDHAKFSPGSGVLFVTVTGDFAKRVDAMPEEEVKAEVLEVLGRMYPGVEIPEPTSFHIPHWLSDPLFRGSYSNWPAGFTRAQHAVVRAKTGGRGRVWFAGEHTSERWFVGFLHGAYYEGVAAAEEIVECLRGGAGCAEVMDFEAL